VLPVSLAVLPPTLSYGNVASSVVAKPGHGQAHRPRLHPPASRRVHRCVPPPPREPTRELPTRAPVEHPGIDGRLVPFTGALAHLSPLPPTPRRPSHKGVTCTQEPPHREPTAPRGARSCSRCGPRGWAWPHWESCLLARRVPTAAKSTRWAPSPARVLRGHARGSTGVEALLGLRVWAHGATFATAERRNPSAA
jgi:hypothetical protein